jgi:hypothetical protein
MNTLRLGRDSLSAKLNSAHRPDAPARAHAPLGRLPVTLADPASLDSAGQFIKWAAPFFWKGLP